MPLYIPLRSDKTCCWVSVWTGWNIFTSHYVQIKLGGLLVRSRRRNIFTSHYVQIKRRKRPNRIFRGWLYIPLRSDKTSSKNTLRKHVFRLYIPLRSDKTIPLLSKTCQALRLYIPLRSDKTSEVLHGRPPPFSLYIPLRSDKTWVISNNDPKEKIFTSHYVQIKRP